MTLVTINIGDDSASAAGPTSEAELKPLWLKTSMTYTGGNFGWGWETVCDSQLPK
jgi:hypothetical protein